LLLGADPALPWVSDPKVTEGAVSDRYTIPGGNVTTPAALVGVDCHEDSASCLPIHELREDRGKTVPRYFSLTVEVLRLQAGVHATVELHHYSSTVDWLVTGPPSSRRV